MVLRKSAMRVTEHACLGAIQLNKKGTKDEAKRCHAIACGKK